MLAFKPGQWLPSGDSVSTVRCRDGLAFSIDKPETWIQVSTIYLDKWIVLLPTI